jgi:UDP-N-acetyl-D-galactosamine dehydrogenase
VQQEYGYELSPQINGPYDALILAVAHHAYIGLSEDYFKSITKENAVFMDVKGIFRNKIHDMMYYSL